MSQPKNLPVVAAASIAALAATSAHGAILDMRAWIDANGFVNNSASNEWQGRIGSATGALMTPSATNWSTPGVQFSVPLIGPLTSPGSDNGAAGPATFDGMWVHPGSGVDAVAVFAPQEVLDVGGVSVHSELIANGLSGNGVRITAFLTRSGVTTPLSGVGILVGTSSDQVDNLTLPSITTIGPGDYIAVHFNDNGSYLFDHVNFNINVIVPAPAGVSLAAAPMLALVARRRR